MQVFCGMALIKASRGQGRSAFVDPERVRAVMRALPSERAAESATNVFRALADPTRVTILLALSTASLCNSDLAGIIGISESAVSHQMRELRLLRIVSAEKRGRMVFYSLTDSHVRHILQDTLRHAREGT